MMSQLLAFLFIFLAFFGLPWTKYAIQTPAYGSCFLPWTLVYSLRGSPLHFPLDLQQIWCTLVVGSIEKSHHARYTTPNKRTQKTNTYTQLREILYTDSQDLLVLIRIVASRYHYCCVDGSTSPGNYGYSHV
jgi:hypothetical protein